MLEIRDIEKLAALARIQLSEDEKKQFLKDIDPILGYVAQLTEVTSQVSKEKQAPLHRNITRGDDLHTSPRPTVEALVAEFPEEERQYLKVKKIL